MVQSAEVEFGVEGRWSEMVLIKKNNYTVPSSTLQYMFVQGTCMQNKPVQSVCLMYVCIFLHKYDHHGTTERDAFLRQPVSPGF